MTCQSLQVRHDISLRKMASDGLMQHIASLRLPSDSGNEDCTLFLSMSAVSESSDEQGSNPIDRQTVGPRHDHLCFTQDTPAASWTTAIRQIHDLSKIFFDFDPCTVQAFNIYLKLELLCNA